METQVKTQAKDFFNYVGALIALLFSTGSLIALWFSTIERIFADNLYYAGDYSNYTLRMSISILVVALPLYFYFLYAIRKSIEREPARKEVWIRKWISYLTAFLAGASVAGNLIATINYFIGGEITARFAFKALAIFIIGGGVLFYYVHEVRDSASRLFNQTYAVAVSIFTLISIITAFAIVGSPATARKAGFDYQRTQILSSLNQAVRNYYMDNGKLPSSMEEVTTVDYKYYSFKDPETNESLVYRKIDQSKYEICADFSLDASKKAKNNDGYTYSNGYYSYGYEQFMSHKAGRQCFDQEIEENLYKPSRD